MKKTAMVLMALFGSGLVTALGQDDEMRFHRGQFEVSPFATYADKVGDDDWGAGASVSYFLTKSLGVGATTYWTNFDGPFFDNVAGEAYFRLPLLKVVAPYAVGGVGYEFETEEWFETLGAGVDFRPFRGFSAFSDIQYRFANETRDGVFVRLGVRLTF